MPAILDEACEINSPFQIVERAIGVRPSHIAPQGLSESGKAVYRVDLPDGRSTVLRTSDRPNTFAFTGHNLNVLRALGLPVQSVLATGTTEPGGSFIILNWIPGRDLIHQLDNMSRPNMTRLAQRVVECQRRVGALPRAQQFGWAPIGRNGNMQKWTHVFGEPGSASTADDGTPLGQLRARLCKLRSRAEPYFDTVTPIPFLDDLTTKNVLVDNGELTGIIDVDFICYGDPLLAVGATIACIAADVPESGTFYGKELISCWSPDSKQRLAIRFYASLWGIGLLQSTDSTINPKRARSLTTACDSWLTTAESGQ